MFENFDWFGSIVAFSPDSEFVACASGPQTFRLREATIGVVCGTHKSHSDIMSALNVAFSPVNKLIVLVGHDRMVLLR